MASPNGLLDVFPMEIIENVLDQFCRNTFSPCRTCCYAMCKCPGYMDDFDLRSHNSNLINIATTCQTLNDSAIRHLYRFPTLATSDQAFLFACTLITRPELRGYVRVLEIQGDRGPPNVPDEVKDYYRARVNVMDPDGAMGLVPSWDDLQPNELLVSLCPNLEILVSDDVFQMASHLPFWSTEVLQCSTLKHLSLWHWDTEDGVLLDQFKPVLHSARESLRTLRVDMLAHCNIVVPATDDDGNPTAPAKNPVTLRRVSRIHLTSSRINESSLRNILLLCPNVEELEYKTGSEDLGREDDQFSPSEAAKTIVEIWGDGDGPLRSLKKVALDLRQVGFQTLGFEAEDNEEELDEEEVDEAVHVLAEIGIQLICLV